MVDETERRAHAIFVAALDRDPAERKSYVAAICDSDAVLRSRVDRLLAAVDRSANFLDSPALGATLGVEALPALSPIAGYRTIRVLGVGGMATVYEAEQSEPRRRVALKVMHSSLTRTSARQRFALETEVLARLKHAGIAQIYQAGTYAAHAGEAVPFFAMEYVEDARTITEHAARAGMTARDRLALFAEVCDALQHGHQAGVIHRDLKPSNVLVNRSGQPKIIDFGVARSVQADAARITLHGNDGQLIGTLNYMSPEQCSGGGRVDTRADVFALGVILYELVTGRVPQDLSHASIPEAIRIIQTGTPPRPSALVPEAKGDLEAIIMKAMEKDPERRYDGAGALAADVRRYLAHQTVQARLPSPWHAARLFACRHKVLVAAAATTVLTIILASASTAWFAYRSWQDSERRLAAEHSAISERDIARRQAYTASIASAYLSYQDRELTRGRQYLDLAPGPLRGWEWWLISGLLDHGELIIDTQDRVMDMQFAPGARRIATVARDGSLAVWYADTGEMIASTPGRAGVLASAVAISDDGRTVYAGFSDGMIDAWTPDTADAPRHVGAHNSAIQTLDCTVSGLLASASVDGEARLWDAVSCRVICSLDDQAGGIHGVRFSLDGSRLVSWNHTGLVWLRDAKTLVPRHRWELGGRVEAAALSNNGRIVAAGGAEGKLRVWDSLDEALIVDTDTSPSMSSVRSLALSPDGATLFSGQIDRSIMVWSLASSAHTTSIVGHDEAVAALAFDQQTNRLISASWDGTVRLWPLGSEAGPRPVSALPAQDAQVLSVAFSPAGDLLATAGRDNVVHLWDPVLEVRLASLKGHAGDVYSARFSPDSTRIASGSADGTIRLWSTLLGTCEAVLEGPGGSVWSVGFSPDGTRVAAGGDDGIVSVWDARSQVPILAIDAHDHRVIHISFSPDGATLATCSRDATVKLWDARSGMLLQTLNGHGSDVFSCVFSADGARLYTGSRDQSVRVWSTTTGRPIDTLDCRGQFVTSLSIDAEGKRLAAGSWFAEVILWDLATHDRVLSFKGQNSAIRSLAFSPTEPQLVCGGHDGSLTMYSASPRERRIEARSAAKRRLTEATALVRRRLAGADASPEALASVFLDPDISEEARPWVRKAILQYQSLHGSPG